MSAFSLELADWNEIKKRAHAFAKGMANNFGFSDDAKVGGTNTGASVGVGVGGVPSLDAGLVKFELVPGSGGRPNQNVLGFTNGYKAGVEFYFKMAQ